MPATRIYAVKPKGDGPTRLVRATHPNNAMRHVAASAFDVGVATQDELVELVGAGVAIETVQHEQQELPQ